MVVEPESEGSTLLPNLAPLPCPHRDPQAVIPGSSRSFQGFKEESWKEGEGPQSHCPSAQLLYSPWASANPAACNASSFFVLKCTENVTFGEDWNGWEEIPALSTELLLKTVGEFSHLLPFSALFSLNRGNLELQYL